MRKIICSNEDNIALTFGNEFTPFVLQYCDGIYSVDNTIHSSENTMTDGSTYLGSTTKMRNIVLGIIDKDKHAMNRGLLYQLFKPKTKGTFTYIEEENDYQEIRVIDYYVESIMVDGDKKCRTAEISLICPDPFFQEINDHIVSMSGWESNFQFIHEFISNKEEFGTRKIEQLKEIFNDSGADNIGITIEMTSENNVKNPSMYHVELDEFIKVGTDLKPLELLRGDKLVITTQTNNKNVYLIRNDEKKNINEFLDEESSFIQIQHGKNNLRYGSDEGEEYLIVDVKFRYRFIAV